MAAEQAGFDAVLGSDHFHPWVDDTSAAGFVWSWLGAVAVKTSDVAARHLGHLPAVPLPPGACRADGRDHRPAVRRPPDARRRHRRGAQRAAAGLPVPRLRRAAGPDAGGAGDHAPHVRRGEGDVPRRVLHDGDRQALLAADGRRADPDGGGRPQVGRVRRHLRRRPDHQREGPGRHGGQGHRAVPARPRRRRARSTWSSPPAGPSSPTARTGPGRRSAQCAACARPAASRRPTRMELRIKADEMDRAEVLASYTVIADAARA